MELLEPASGQRVLEVAAGPGETGFLVVPLIQPGGELVSTDAAPEMVDVARRRAEALGLTGIRFSVEDVVRLSPANDTFDRVLCRFGTDARARHGARGRRDRAGAPPRRSVPSLAVWASSRLNPWMTAPGKAALELGLADPPDHDAPGPFRLADPKRLQFRHTGLEASRSNGSRTCRSPGRRLRSTNGGRRRETPRGCSGTCSRASRPTRSRTFERVPRSTFGATSVLAGHWRCPVSRASSPPSRLPDRARRQAPPAIEHRPAGFHCRLDHAVADAVGDGSRAIELRHLPPTRKGSRCSRKWEPHGCSSRRSRCWPWPGAHTRSRPRIPFRRRPPAPGAAPSPATPSQTCTTA